jgi:hypothetical protein
VRSTRLALIPLMLAACAPSGSNTGEITIVGADDIEVVAPTVEFANVRDMVVTPGAIWILDRAAPFVTRISMLGDTVVRTGREGRGPGEFLDPVALQVDAASDAAHVWDLGNVRRLTVEPTGGFSDSELLDEAGIPRGRRDIREISYADPHRIRTVDGSTFVVRFPNGVNRTADFVGASLHGADLSLSPGEVIHPYSQSVADDGRVFREFLQVPLWDACESGVVLWQPALSRVMWMNVGGEVSVQVDVPLDRTPLELTDVAGYLELMARLELGMAADQTGVDYEDMARRTRDRFAAQAPLATDVRCAPDQTVWLQLFGTSHDPLGRGLRWLRVERDGPIHTVEFPPEFKPVAMTDAGVYGLYEGQQGHQQLALWKGGPVID